MVVEILKETLIEGHKKPYAQPRNAPIPSKFLVSRDGSFANVGRGHLGSFFASQLTGWKRRACGS